VKNSPGQVFNPHKAFQTFSPTPEKLSRYRGLSPGAKLVWGRLYRYAGNKGYCWPSIPILAGEVGMGKTQARKYLHELIGMKFIKRESQPGKSGVYRFLWHEAFEGETGESRKIPPIRKTGEVRKTGGKGTGRADTKRVNEGDASMQKRPLMKIFNPFSFSSRDERWIPPIWERDREIRRMERELPLEQIREYARAERESGGRRNKWRKILADRLLNS